MAFLSSMAIILVSLNRLFQREDGLSEILLSLLMGIIILAVVCLPTKIVYKCSWNSFGLRLPTCRLIIWSGLSIMSVFLFLVFVMVYSLAVSAVGWTFLLPPDVASVIVLPKGYLAVATFCMIGVWTPFTEEILFRGFIFSGLRTRFGPHTSVIITSLMFSGMHAHIGVLIPTFVMSLFLTYLYRATNSIWPCILAHSVNNCLTLAITFIPVWTSIGS